MKYEPNKQDDEDAAQEREIKEWFKRTGKNDKRFDFRHLTSSGRTRDTRVRASFSLDQKVSGDTSSTFADLIAGCDGRDLYSGKEPVASDYLDAYLACLGFNEEESVWLLKMLKLSQAQSKELLKISAKDLESLKRFGLYRE